MTTIGKCCCGYVNMICYEGCGHGKGLKRIKIIHANGRADCEL